MAATWIAVLARKGLSCHSLSLQNVLRNSEKLVCAPAIALQFPLPQKETMSAQAAERMACLSRSPALRYLGLPCFVPKPCSSRFLQPSFRQGVHKRCGLRWIGVNPLHKGSRLSSGYQVLHHRRLSAAAPQAVLTPPPPRTANGMFLTSLWFSKE